MVDGQHAAKTPTRRLFRKSLTGRPGGSHPACKLPRELRLISAWTLGTRPQHPAGLGWGGSQSPSPSVSALTCVNLPSSTRPEHTPPWGPLTPPLPLPLLFPLLPIVSQDRSEPQTAWGGRRAGSLCRRNSARQPPACDQTPKARDTLSVVWSPCTLSQLGCPRLCVHCIKNESTGGCPGAGSRPHEPEAPPAVLPDPRKAPLGGGH